MNTQVFIFTYLQTLPVAESNAIDNKLTVVVEVLDASVAQSAVFSSQGSYAATRVTKS